MARTTEIITGIERFDALEAAWTDLLARAGRNEPFLMHGWLSAWCAHFAAPGALRFVISFDGDRLVAALPLVRATERWRGQSVRTLRFPQNIESGNLRGGFIVADDPDEAADEVVRRLVETADDWERLDLSGLTVGSPGSDALARAIARAGLDGEDWSVDSELYYLPVPGSWDDYLKARSKKFRRNRRHAWNRYHRTPGAKIETATAPGALDEALERMIALDRRSTKSMRAGVIPVAGKVEDFYRDIVARLGPAGGCRIDLLSVGEETVASLFTVFSRQTVFFLHNSYSPMVAKLGVGRLLFLNIIEDVFTAERGTITEIDFNGRTVFVRTFSDHARAVVKRTLYSPTFRARIARLRETVVAPALRARRRPHEWLPLTPTPAAAPRTAPPEADRAALPPALQRSENLAFFEDGRTALDHGLEALPLRAGDEIAFPAYHCGSEFEVLLRRGFRLRYYDVPTTLAVGPETIARAVGPETRAVYLIHYLGWPQDTAAISAFCRERGLLLIEDCAQALYGDCPDRPIGRHGDLAIFSLHKFLPLADGGAATAGPNLPRIGSGRAVGRRDERAARLRTRTMRLARKTGTRAFAGTLAAWLLPALGRRLGLYPSATGRAMTAFSRRTLAATDHSAVAAARRANFAAIAERLADTPGLAPLHDRLEDGVVPLLFPAFVDNAGPLAEALSKAGVEAGAHWAGGDFRFPLQAFPNIIFLKTHLVVFPVHQEISIDDIEYMCGAIKNILRA